MSIAPRRRSRRRLAAGALVVCAAVWCRCYLGAVAAQKPAMPLPAVVVDEYRQKVLPVLSSVCMNCHNDLEYAGALSLEPFVDPKIAVDRPEIWARILDKLKAREMPPASVAPLPAEQSAAVMGWIERAYGLSASHALDPATADPGRVTARRLNRVEYDNTIRDLLGVTLKPAEQFPVDDSGYGFDNIGDVLTLSPMLMEKYMSAARTVSTAAVFGESYPEKPTLLAKLQPKKDQDDLPAAGNVLPFSLRGALYGTYHFPVEADYEFRWRYVNLRGGEVVITTDAPAARGTGAGGTRGAGVSPAPPGAPGDAPPRGRGGAGAAGRGQAGRGAGPRELTDEEKKARDEKARTAAPPELMVFTVDGNRIYDFPVEGNNDYNYSRGETIVRLKLTAGDHALRISWPGLANVADPAKQYAADGRRKLHVDYLDILGPFRVVKAPPAGFRRIFICGTPGKYSAACARQIVEQLTTRAYRRPATPQEVQRYLSLVNQVRKRDSFEEGARVALEAILMSPNFLFRVERDQPAAASGASYRIGDYELASRLSYFLWSSMPDEPLFEAARLGRLHEKPVLDAQVERMLADPKAASLAENFGEQWLNLRLMDRKKPDAAQFRGVDDELLDAMRQETRLFLNAIVREDRSILDLIDGKFTFLNGPLARYYGIPGVDGEDFRRVDLDGEQRSGIVTQASVLIVSSYATRTSPVLRGKWVLETLLGAGPPPPPDGIPALVTKDLGTAASMRQRLEQHRANPSCGACHNQMDPIGFSLENYDAAGGWRAKDGNFDIDNTGTLPDGRRLAGAGGLKQALRALSGAFTEHFSDRLMTYALGRGLERADRPALQQITSDLVHDNCRFSTLVASIVNSRPFLMRSRVTQ